MSELSKSKRKSKLSSVEWQPDDSSRTCMRCNTEFSLLRGIKKHHCRRCGRLVCHDCSSKTLVLDNDPKPVRACEDCYSSVMIKKERLQEVNYQKEREIALLEATSRVSNSLVRVYFLDGSFKTVFFDQNTTAAEISAKVCYSVKVALFQVERDLKNSLHYTFLQADDCIVDILASWETHHLEFAKLVVPLYDVASSLREKAPPGLLAPPWEKNSHTSRQASVATSRASISAPSSTPPISDNKRHSMAARPIDVVSASSVPHASSLHLNPDMVSGLGDSGVEMLLRSQEEELALWRKDYWDLRMKFECLKSLHSKNFKLEREKVKEQARSSGDEDIESNSDITTTDRYSNQASRDLAPMSATGGYEGILKKKNFFNNHFVAHYFILSTEGKLYYYKNEEDAKKKHHHQGRYDIRHVRSAVSNDDSRILQLTLSNKKISLLAPSAEIALAWVNAISAYSLQHRDLSRYLETTTMSDKPDDIANIMKQSSQRQVKMFFEKINETEVFFLRFDDIINNALQHGVNEPQHMYHMYEIVSAMQSLYGYVMHFGEQWTTDLKNWLLSMLRQKMILPIDEPEMLMAVIQCLAREKMLISSETINVVNQVIEMSFEDGFDTEMRHTTEGMLEGVSRMIQTLEQVIEDLVPLLPHDFNVVSMFQEKANLKIKNDIKTFYALNKSTMSSRELLTLLSFADAQTHTLEKYGVDTQIVTELYNDLLRDYSKCTQSMLKKWMQRIHDTDVAAEAKLSKGLGQTTHWPNDLMSCVGECLSLPVQELTIDAAEMVCRMVLNMLSEFVVLQRSWLDTAGRVATPDRLCAYVNNHQRFASLLLDRRMLIMEELMDCDELDAVFQQNIKLFKEEGENGLETLERIVCDDFKQVLQQGLFRDGWETSNGTAKLLVETLEACLDDLQHMLARDEHVGSIYCAIVRSVAATYLEILMTSGVVISARAGDRLREDFKVILAGFEASQYSTRLNIHTELKPLHDCIEVLTIDLKKMSNFVRLEFYDDFGSVHWQRIWQHLMAIRDSRQFIDDVLVNIHSGWTPPPSTGKVTLPYMDRLKAPRKGLLASGKGY